MCCPYLESASSHSVGPVLFGQNAQVWDYCMFDTMSYERHLSVVSIESSCRNLSIIVWKVVPHYHASLKSPAEDHVNLICSFAKVSEAACICRLVGHEGSIFRIAWSSDGSKLISVSDDRRLFPCLESASSHSVGPVLFGHNARVWDCCMFDTELRKTFICCFHRIQLLKLFVGGEYGEACIIGTPLLVTTGLYSALKAQQLHASVFESSERHAEKVKELTDRTKIHTGGVSWTGLAVLLCPHQGTHSPAITIMERRLFKDSSSLQMGNYSIVSRELSRGIRVML